MSVAAEILMQFSFQGVSRIHIHWKGAEKIVLGACTQYLDSYGQLLSIEEEKKVRDGSFKSRELADGMKFI